MYKKLLNKIHEFDKIVIFRHQRPDGDAMFSALAVYTFIKDNFKSKQVKLAGNEDYDLISLRHKISDNFIKDSLAIVVDTSRSDRTDDHRMNDCKYIIKIDHHPVVDEYGDLNIVDTKCAAACELIADIFLSNTFKPYKHSQKLYEYLYCGIVTDTINFKTTSTTSRTLKIASLLAEKGSLQISKLVEFLFDKDIDDFYKTTDIRKYLKVEKKFAYIYLNKKELNKIGISAVDAKNHVDIMNNIKNIKIWLFAVENNNLIEVSVRSKRGYIINLICQKYGGGGHANASGIKDITKVAFNKLLKELIELSTK